MSLWGKKDGADIWDGSSGQSYEATTDSAEITFSASIASHRAKVGDVLVACCDREVKEYLGKT